MLYLYHLLSSQFMDSRMSNNTAGQSLIEFRKAYADKLQLVFFPYQ